ncbi:MAG: malate dehydrogenase [Aliarcobacter sp.]|nr:malate dehydrogenase [Aliarcobacter sp.]
MENNKKVGIIGAGNVGATLAFSLANKNICSQIVLKDLRANVVEAMALDISQAARAAKSSTKVSFASNAQEFNNCDVIVITAGIPRKPGMSRDDLLLTNAKIMTSVINEIAPFNKDAIYIIVSNPLDAMVYTALKATSLPRNKIIGMAGVLDSSRMAHFIQEKLTFTPDEIKAAVMGGHGDEMVPLANYSSVDGKDLSEFLTADEIEEIIVKTRNGGAQIVKLLETGSAYYAPAYSTALMVEAILTDSKESYPCAVMLKGEYGYEDIVAGVPVVLGKDGFEKIIELELNEEQKAQFAKSISAIKELVNTIDKNF